MRGESLPGDCGRRGRNGVHPRGSALDEDKPEGRLRRSGGRRRRGRRRKRKRRKDFSYETFVVIPSNERRQVLHGVPSAMGMASLGHREPATWAWSNRKPGDCGEV